jgi:hypothetical protein
MRRLIEAAVVRGEPIKVLNEMRWEIVRCIVHGLVNTASRTAIDAYSSLDENFPATLLPCFTRKKHCQCGTKEMPDTHIVVVGQHSLEEFLSEFIAERSTDCKTCKTYARTEVIIHDHVLIHLPSAAIPARHVRSFPQELSAGLKTFFLRGGFITENGHFKTFARRGTQWVVYDDLRKRANAVRAEDSLYISHVLYTI